MQEDLYSLLQDAHEQGKLAAVTKLPPVDVNTLISLVNDIMTGEQTPQQAADQFKAEGEQAVKAYAQAFATVAGTEAINAILKSIPSDGVKDLAESDYSNRLVHCSQKISADVALYFNEKIDGPEFIRRMGKTDVGNLAMELAGAAGIKTRTITDTQEVIKNIQHIRKMSLAQASMIATATAYVILMDTLDKAHKAHLKDEQIIAQCRQSARQIVAYREKLEAQVNQYLNKHLTIFEKGFAAMDQALVNGDSNQYIAGNAAIQNALGRYVQFWDQDSFDELMESDIPLKL